MVVVMPATVLLLFAGETSTLPALQEEMARLCLPLIVGSRPWAPVWGTLEPLPLIPRGLGGWGGGAGPTVPPTCLSPYP